MTRAWTQADFDKALKRPLTAKERRFAASEYRKDHREPLETITRRRLAQVTKERDVLRCICEYLTVEGVPWFRMNAGEAESPAIEAAFYSLRAAAKRNRICLAPAGTADLLVIVPQDRPFTMHKHFPWGCGWPVPLWIETKRPGSRARRSPEQITFAEHMQSIGCLHIFASDVRDVMEVLPPKIRNVANRRKR